ncbi:Pre-mRNA-splicing factor SPF27 [Tuber borchii]|uniref:Pre-mRNA-splicing factor SPF27 n=1 Tax=Tuber borchii TaxID=42251 RepID=A0A2T7A8A5_TUBBO|nr:Pre-mRNA-splicing factor SPF27 [Tuber borchii]
MATAIDTVISYDSLPYIDTPPTDSELESINNQITSELSADHKTTPHPRLPPLVEPNFRPATQAELDRIAAGKPWVGGIDVSRYELGAEASHSALAAAYASAAHVEARLANLTLLNEFGKNAWLVHNSQLEALLKGLEEELMELKTECEVVNKERKGVQVDAQPELAALEQRWKRGIGRVLEVEAGAEAVRQETLKRRREKTEATDS